MVFIETTYLPNGHPLTVANRIYNAFSDAIQRIEIDHVEGIQGGWVVRDSVQFPSPELGLQRNISI